ncbi:MAG: N-acetyl-1-D-myo-inositol-2-amino-2-deoxy-alpha-D-glucopyranoside deacetylase [Actinomycetes bacterium]
MTDRRMLLVHAHPDDETIGTGATMARYVADGAQVTLVTATSGEEGEILLSHLDHLAADQTDDLGAHRRVELGAAMAELGVTDWRLLGGPGKYRDSGMIGTPANDRPDCFWRADLLTAATDIVAIIREVRPHVVITYDMFGGYGHPDHIQAHRATTYAVSLAAVPSFRPDLGQPWQVFKVYWPGIPRSIMMAGIEALRASGDQSEFATMDVDSLDFVIDDDVVTTAIDATAFLDSKMAALRAHATQVSVDSGFFALSNNLGNQALGIEYYQLVAGAKSGPFDAQGRETDLFAGIG